MSEQIHETHLQNVIDESELHKESKDNGLENKWVEFSN